MIYISTQILRHLFWTVTTDVTIRDQRGKGELVWQAKEQILFQLFCFRVKSFERHYELQDTRPSTLENQQLADYFNDFYCRFGKNTHTHPAHLSTQLLTPPVTSLYPTPALKISEDDVCQVFRENKRKAPGPDSVSPACLKTCADQLAPIFTKIFKRSLNCAKSPHASNVRPSSSS